MTLPKFILGLVIVIAIVSLWSYVDAASLGTILLRALICAVILQVGYFLAVVAMVMLSPRKTTAKGPENVALEAAPARQAEDLTPKGSPH